MVKIQSLFFTLPEYMQQFILQIIVMLIPTIIYAYRSEKGVRQTLKLYKPTKSIFDFKTMAMLLTANLIINLCIKLFQLEKDVAFEASRQLNLNKKSLLIQIIFIGILAPIIEELTFRGGVLTKLNTKMSAKKSAILDGLFFGIAHGNPIQFIAGTLFGIISSHTVYSTKSILPAIYLHIMINTLSVISVNVV